MRKIFGTFLRALSVVWFIFATIRIVAVFVGVMPGFDIFVGFFGVGVAVATFKFGTWLKTSKPKYSFGQRLDRVKSGWWGIEYKSRFVIFLSCLWIIAASLWQDDGERNLGLILWPSIGLLVAYYLYCRLVVQNLEPSNPVESDTVPQVELVIYDKSRESVRESTSVWAALWAGVSLAAIVAITFLVFQSSYKTSSESVSISPASSVGGVRSEQVPFKLNEFEKNDSDGVYENYRFGFQVKYPRDILFPQGESENGDGQVFSSSDGAFTLAVWGEIKPVGSSVDELFEYESRGLVHRNKKMVVTYKRRQDDWFVVSGVEGSFGIYRRVHVRDGSVARLEMRWPIDQVERWKPTIEKVSVSHSY